MRSSKIVSSVLTFLASIVTAGLVSATVAAAPTVNFGTVDNLPKDSVSTLNVTATGLTPNVQVTFLQCTGGDPDLLGEICHVAGCPQPQSGCLAQIHNTGESGNITVPVDVSYNSAAYYGAPFDVCENSTNPLRTCYLQMMYIEDNAVIAQTNLYFGPRVTPPVGPLSKDDCKGNKWSTFTTYGFKNQGACISYVNKL